MSARTQQSSLTDISGLRARATAARARAKELRAPFSLRCGAMLVDYTVTIAVLAFATLLARMPGSGARAAEMATLTLGYLLAAGFAVFNFIVLAGFSGRTLGKWVTGLRVEKHDGTALSFGRAAVRHLVGYPLSVLTLGLGFLLAAFNAEGRTLHDLIAGTTVVRVRKRARRAR